MKEVAAFSVQMVARRTGLSPYLIRAWELRYKVVQPRRSPSGQRRYTDADVRRLSLLRRMTRAGHSIGSIAALPRAQLKRLATISEAPSDAGGTVDLAVELQAKCIAAVREMNQPQLVRCLRRALFLFGHQGLLRRMVAPLAEKFGELWREGDLTAAHEHFFTAAAKMFLGNLTQQFAVERNAPTLIATTPVGQHHELGAFMAAVAAMHLGWRAIYLGPSLPAADIVSAAFESCADAVALSIVYPEDDRALNGELRTLGDALTGNTRIIVGGRAAPRYRATLRSANAIIVKDLAGFSDQLDTLRAQRPLSHAGS